MRDTLRALRQPEPPGWEAGDRRAAGDGGTAQPDGALGDRHDDGRELGESSDCILTLCERKSGYVLIGKLSVRPAAEANRALLELMARHPGRAATITSDNGTESHWYGRIEAVSQVKFYFATPHHSWERGTNEPTS